MEVKTDVMCDVYNILAISANFPTSYVGTNLLPQISYLDSITKSLFDLDPDVKIDLILILILIKKGEVVRNQFYQSILTSEPIAFTVLA